MSASKINLPFTRSGYYLAGLVVLAFAGFWPSYFSKLFNGTLDYAGYFHLHAITALLWIAMLIAQPILIRNKKFALHRQIGKLSYVAFPLLLISVLLLAHSQAHGRDNMAIELFFPFKDLIVLCVAYPIAIYYRRQVEIHARAMIATGIVFIEPALVRLINHQLPEGSGMFGYQMTIACVYGLLILLIFNERKRNKGRWVFPLILGIYLIVHSIILGNIQIGLWERFASWFAQLPLT